MSVISLCHLRYEAPRAARNRRTADNLTKIIDALEGETTTDDSGENDAG
jgi:hypothetical protein